MSRSTKRSGSKRGRRNTSHAPGLSCRACCSARRVRSHVGLAPRGVNAGNGFVFVSHTGDVFPSGFLPVCGGNVRTQKLADIYRLSPLFRTLRDPERSRTLRALRVPAHLRRLALARLRADGKLSGHRSWCGYERREKSGVMGHSEDTYDLYDAYDVYDAYDLYDS